MNLSETNCEQIVGKSLTFPDKYCVTKKNNFYEYDIPSVTIGYIVTAILNATDTIKSPNALLAGINFRYDPFSNTTFIENGDNTFVIKNINGSDSITIKRNGQVVIVNDLTIICDMNAVNGQFSGNINANNLNLLNEICAMDGKILGDLEVKGDINTNIIKPKNGELFLSAPLNHSVTIPNVRNHVFFSNNCQNPLQLNSIQVKAFKIFVVSVNINLCADPSCNGIEIIIYNDNACNSITVNDISSCDTGPTLVVSVLPQTTKRLIYLFDCTGATNLRKWIIV